MESVLNWSVIISIIGVLVVLTNIVVQVLKKVTWDKLPTNALAMIVSLVLTLGAFFAYCSIKGSPLCGIWCLPQWSSRSWWLMRQCSDLTS